MITLEKIREEIAKTIQYSGKTQKKIAEEIGVKQPTISEYLYGKSCPSLDTFARLCVALDLDANEILCIKK